MTYHQRLARMLERSFDLSYSEFQTEWSSSLVNDWRIQVANA